MRTESRIATVAAAGSASSRGSGLMVARAPPLPRVREATCEGGGAASALAERREVLLRLDMDDVDVEVALCNK